MRTPPLYGRHHPPPVGVETTFWDRRAIWTPDRLDGLTGPATGIVALPRELDWSSPSATIDLGDRASVQQGYAAVLREARSETDFTILNRTLLLEVWRELFLPARVRAVWETQFPELRS